MQGCELDVGFVLVGNMIIACGDGATVLILSMSRLIKLRYSYRSELNVSTSLRLGIDLRFTHVLWSGIQGLCASEHRPRALYAKPPADRVQDPRSSTGS